MKQIKEYYQEEYNVLKERLDYYTEWGYTDELSPLVSILYDAVNAIKEKLSNLK